MPAARRAAAALLATVPAFGALLATLAPVFRGSKAAVASAAHAARRVAHGHPQQPEPRPWDEEESDEGDDSSGYDSHESGWSA